jgi:sulfonate transport system ATP-binding protein
MDALLEVRIDRKAFDTAPVLERLALELARGEVVALVGASGCGKSTLLRIVSGLDAQYEGRITLDGAPLHGIRPEIGVVFQEPRLLPWLNVADNIAFGHGRAAGGGARARQLLEQTGLAGYEAALPKQLSGGQAQRVAIARALFSQPRLLLLDEPFSAVDAFTRMKLQDLLLDVARRNRAALLLVTHDIDEAAYLGDRVLVLDRDPGRLRRTFTVTVPRPRDRRDPRLARVKSDVLTELYDSHAL